MTIARSQRACGRHRISITILQNEILIATNHYATRQNMAQHLNLLILITLPANYFLFLFN